jgi:site-specific recombinase XerD
MFIFKRNSHYHLEWFDETENRIKRISTKCKKKNEALAFLFNFRENLKSKKKIDFISLENFQTKYLEYTKKARSESYNRNIIYSFNFLIENFNPDIPLNKISTNQIESALINKYSESKYASAMIYRTLKSAFKKAVQWNYIESNPFDKIKLPKIPQNKPVFINDIELKQIISYEKNPTLRDIYLFAFYSGCRLNEILNLKWSSINFSERLISIKNDETFTTKSKKERIIPINNYLFENLKNRLPKVNNINNNDYVFIDAKGKKFRADTVSKWFKAAVIETSKHINLDTSIHFHSLRHSFASCLVQRGVSIYEISKLLGHSDIKVTEIYSHLKSENLRSAVEMLN